MCTVVSLSNPAGAQHADNTARNRASADKRGIVVDWKEDTHDSDRKHWVLWRGRKRAHSHSSKRIISHKHRAGNQQRERDFAEKRQHHTQWPQKDNLSHSYIHMNFTCIKYKISNQVATVNKWCWSYSRNSFDYSEPYYLVPIGIIYSITTCNPV